MCLKIARYCIFENKPIQVGIKEVGAREDFPVCVSPLYIVKPEYLITTWTSAFSLARPALLINRSGHSLKHKETQVWNLGYSKPLPSSLKTTYLLRYIAISTHIISFVIVLIKVIVIIDHNNKQNATKFKIQYIKNYFYNLKLYSKSII